MGSFVYIYLKRRPVTAPAVTVSFPALPKIPRSLLVSASLIMFSAGVLLLGNVIWPLIEWQIIYLPKQPQSRFASPIPRFASPAIAEENGLPMNVQEGSSDNLLRASNWYPGVSQNSTTSAGITYNLSIPKLRIENAEVTFGGEDLKKSLIGWGTSSLPGIPGTNIIFGHSALPQFYNPKNYTTIFSLLPTLDKGDSIYIFADRVAYKYLVFDMQTVDPDDYSILEQRFDDSYIALVTCVPPGTYWKRLIVRARIAQNN